MEPEEQTGVYILPGSKSDDHIKIHSDWTEVCGDSCVSRHTVCKWFDHLEVGKSSGTNTLCSG